MMDPAWTVAETIIALIGLSAIFVVVLLLFIVTVVAVIKIVSE